LIFRLWDFMRKPREIRSFLLPVWVLLALAEH